MKEENGFFVDWLIWSWRINLILFFWCLVSWMIRLIYRSDGLLFWVGKWEILIVMENKVKVIEIVFKIYGYIIVLVYLRKVDLILGFDFWDEFFYVIFDIC